MENNIKTWDMDFGQAIHFLKSSKRVARKGWNGKNMWIMYCEPEQTYEFEMDNKVYGRRPYIYMKTTDNMLVPWTASQTDVLAEDWYIV